MEIEIPYDGIIEKLEFPDSTDIIEPKYYPALKSEQVSEKIKSAWFDFQSRFENKNISIIVNDATRRVPNAAILSILLEFLDPEKITIFIATGTHRKPSEDELTSILGEFKDRFAEKLIIHDCYDSENMIKIGVTSLGTEVKVNRLILDSQAIICINSVEPHFFAGFTGGRKSIIPGLAAFDTVVANHSHAKSEFAESLNLENNPVNLDLQEAVGFFSEIPLFSIQLILSRTGEIVDIFCGELKESFIDACDRAREVYSVPITRYYDIVLAVGEPPLDANLYQLQKAQEHGARAVADGGILIVVGACREGTGSPYFVQLADDYPTPAEALSPKAEADNRFGIHKLIKTARRLEKIKIWYVTKLDDNVIRKLYFEPRKSSRESLRLALDYVKDPRGIAVLRDACFMVPVRV